MELNMKYPSSSTRLQPKACRLGREIKNRTWGKEECEIMHHFVCLAKHQSCATSTAQGWKEGTGQLGIRTNGWMQEAISKAVKEQARRQHTGRMWLKEQRGKKSQRTYRKHTMAVKYLVLLRRDRIVGKGHLAGTEMSEDGPVPRYCCMRETSPCGSKE